MVRSILEREQELAELGVAAREAASGTGSIVLIEGEAGIGKSSLVNSIRSVLPAEARLLLGYCDDLATPRVLGPLRDMRDQVGTSLTETLRELARVVISLVVGLGFYLGFSRFFGTDDVISLGSIARRVFKR